jgi:vacuolar-type H+-ATPase subunit I/STV1
MTGSAAPSPSRSPFTAPSASAERAWIRVALLIGIFYLAAGFVFGWLAGTAGSPQMRSAWRMMAWLVSAVGFAMHIRYEYVRLQNTSVVLARHVSTGVAIGAFGLALAANIHALTVGSTHRVALGISLVLWPLLTAIPAFLVALGASAILVRTRAVQ